MKVLLTFFLLQLLYADFCPNYNCHSDKSYSVSLKSNFTHHATRGCVLHSASEPFRLNEIKRSSLQQMFQVGFPSREYDIQRFSALTNPEFPLLMTNWVLKAQSDWTFTTTEMSDFEKVFDPKFIDLGARIQFHQYSQKFFMQNPQQNFNLKIVAIKTDSPWVTLLSHDANQIIRPDRRISFEFQYLPTVVGEHQCYIYFMVEIQSTKNDIANHLKSKKITSKTLYLKIKATVRTAFFLKFKITENEYKLKAIIRNNIPFNQTTIQNIEIYNSQRNALIIEEISVLEKQAYVRLPKFRDDDQNELDPTELKYALNGYDPNVKEKYLLELPQNSQRTVAQIVLVGSKPGYIRDWLKVKIGKNIELIVPVIGQVQKPGVNFVQDQVNLGVISSINNFEHEFVAQVQNSATYPVEIIDIQVQISPEYTCFNVHLFQTLYRQKSKSLIIGPFEKPIDLVKLTLYGSENIESKSYSGKIILQMRNLNNGQNDTAEMVFSFSEYFQPLIYQPTDLSVYVNVPELNTAFGMHSEVTQKVTQYFLKGVEMLEVEREVYIRNNMTSNLFITNIYSQSEEISIRSIKHQEFTMSRKQQVFTMSFQKAIKVLDNYFLQTYLAIEVDFQFIIPLQVTVFDKSLQCITEDRQKVLGRCSLNGPHRLINFGNVAINEQRTKRFFVHNWNPVSMDLIIQQMENEGNQIKIVLENIINTRNTSEKKNIVKQATKRKMVIKLDPKTVGVILIYLNAETQEEETRIFTLSTTQEQIDITVSYNILRGSLSFSPWQLRFDQCFPGYSKNLLITARSTYNVKFKVNDIVSTDKRFIVTLINNTINPDERVQIAEVRFDASHQEFNYLNASISNWNLFLSYEDILQWRHIQDQWSSLVEKSKTDVKSMINVFTEIVSQIQIPASVILVTPQLLKEQSIDFGLQGINSKQTRQITLHNPSDNPVKVQLFLGSSNFSHPLLMDKMLYDFSSQDVDEIQLCISEYQDHKIQQFFDSIDYIYFDKSSFVQFEIRSSNSDEYEYFNFVTGYREQKATYFVKQLVNQEAQQLLSRFQHVRCKQGKVPQKIKTFMDYNQFQVTLSDPENFRFFPDWHLQFRRFLDEFIEIKDISLMTYATHQSVQDFSPTPSFIEKIQHAFHSTTRNNQRQIDTVDQKQFYLTPEVKGKFHIIQPHQNITLNALIYQPGGNNATLIIKNNLTVIQMVPLLGKGGIAKLVLKGNFTQNTIQIQENELQDSKIKLLRTFYLSNVGNLTINPNHIKIGNNECSFSNIYLNDCRPFALQSTETKEFQLTIDSPISSLPETLQITFFTQSYCIRFSLKIQLPLSYVSNSATSYFNYLMLVTSILYLLYVTNNVITSTQSIRVNLIGQFELQGYTPFETLLTTHKQLGPQAKFLTRQGEQGGQIGYDPPATTTQQILQQEVLQQQEQEQEIQANQEQAILQPQFQQSIQSQQQDHDVSQTNEESEVIFPTKRKRSKKQEKRIKKQQKQVEEDVVVKDEESYQKISHSQSHQLSFSESEINAEHPKSEQDSVNLGELLNEHQKEIPNSKSSISSPNSFSQGESMSEDELQKSNSLSEQNMRSTSQEMKSNSQQEVKSSPRNQFNLFEKLKVQKRPENFNQQQLPSVKFDELEIAKVNPVQSWDKNENIFLNPTNEDEEEHQDMLDEDFQNQQLLEQQFTPQMGPLQIPMLPMSTHQLPPSSNSSGSPASVQQQQYNAMQLLQYQLLLQSQQPATQQQLQAKLVQQQYLLSLSNQQNQQPFYPATLQNQQELQQYQQYQALLRQYQQPYNQQLAQLQQLYGNRANYNQVSSSSANATHNSNFPHLSQSASSSQQANLFLYQQFAQQQAPAPPPPLATSTGTRQTLNSSDDRAQSLHFQQLLEQFSEGHNQTANPSNQPPYYPYPPGFDGFSKDKQNEK